MTTMVLAEGHRRVFGVRCLAIILVLAAACEFSALCYCISCPIALQLARSEAERGSKGKTCDRNSES